MEFKRTPDECFDGLADYPFEPNYLILPANSGHAVKRLLLPQTLLG
jgi:hypothetical protein